MSEQMQERTDGPQVVKIEQRAADYNLTEHCNLRCAGCDHSSPLLPKKFAEVAEYQRDLAALSQVLHLGELKILGGEPLLHPDLIEFLRTARASGIADEITLVTNGVLLHRCDPVTFELIDKLWVSLYPAVRLRLEVSELEALSKKYNFKLELKVMNSFRFTTINRRHRDAALVRQIFTRCALAHEWSCHTRTAISPPGNYALVTSSCFSYPAAISDDLTGSSRGATGNLHTARSLAFPLRFIWHQ
jgi:organic radical activating enzyme